MSSEDEYSSENEHFYSTKGEILTIENIDNYEDNLWTSDLKALSTTNLNIYQSNLKTFFSNTLCKKSFSLGSFKSLFEKYKKTFFESHPHSTMLSKSLDNIPNTIDKYKCNCMALKRKKYSINRTFSEISFFDKDMNKSPLEISLIINDLCSACWNVSYLTCDHRMLKIPIDCRVCKQEIRSCK